MSKFEILANCIINNSNILRDNKNLERKEIRKFDKGKECAEYSRFLCSISKNVIVDYHQCKLIFRILSCELYLDFIIFTISWKCLSVHFDIQFN